MIMTSLLSFLNRSSQVTSQNISVCPNCWGRQEWCDQYIPVSLSREKDRWDFSQFRNGFILKFVKKYL